MEDFDRTAKFVSEIENQTDRGAAIIATAWLEEQLSAVIKLQFKDDASAWKRLFGSSGPMGTLSAKIDIAKLLGVLSDDSYSDMHQIRKIRNEFAHEVMAKDFGSLCFDTPHIKDRCLSLKRTEDEKHDSPRKAFLRTCGALWADFNLIVYQAQIKAQ